MAKAKKIPTFDEVLAALGSERFDVSPATEGENRAAGAYRVSKGDCAAEIAPSLQPGSPVRLLAKGGWVLGGEIARLLDRGYQKFLKTTKLEIPATADHLRAIHTFNDELKEAAGAQVLYNEALGTTSDRYVYDRVSGQGVGFRVQGPEISALAALELAVGFALADTASLGDLLQGVLFRERCGVHEFGDLIGE